MTATSGARAPAQMQLETSEGFLPSRDGLALRFLSQRSLGAPSDAAPGAALPCEVVIVHGYGEHLGRYDHVAEAFLARGHAVHRFEYRVHGLSQGRRAHVRRFDDNLDDLDAFLAHLGAPQGGRPRALVAHSLGGLICARFLQARGGVAQAGIARVVLSSPFFGLGFTPPAWKRAFSKLASRLLPALPVGNELSVSALTSDEEIQRRTAADPLYLHETTPRWFCEVERAQAAALEDAGKLTAPLLLLLGERDEIASPEASRRLFERLVSPHRAQRTFAGMRHELFNEVARDEVFTALFDWLEGPLG